MADYLLPLEFGVFPTPEATRLDELFEIVARADNDGLDLVGVQDHPYQPRFVDTMALLGTILARTKHVRVFPDVANLPLRPPAMLAKQAATLDLLSGGRFELGLGTGVFFEGIQAMGGRLLDKPTAAGALKEGVRVIRQMWARDEPAPVRGRHYSLIGARPGPLPAHDIGIWLGVAGPQMLDFLGRNADGWLPSSAFVPPEKLHDMQNRIDDGAAAAGRDPREIRRIYNVFGSITNAQSHGLLQGPVEQWVEELTILTVEYGMSSFVFGPSTDPVRQTAIFASEVAPAVRAAVARHREEAPQP